MRACASPGTQATWSEGEAGGARVTSRAAGLAPTKGATIAAESKKAVIAAIAGNAAIATIKFAAATATGSSAMLAEGIHSLVDTGNGGLLLLGLRRSARPPDAAHPFGHGQELYFWSLIVALIIFGVGGGMSIYEGITHLQHPSPLEDPTLNYVVLAAAAVFEGISWTIAYRQFRKVHPTAPVLSVIHEGKDPSIFTVLIEDTLALLGLAIAFFAVFFGHRLDNPYIDGVGSIVIGALLASAAVLLAAETRGLLLGESVSPAMARTSTTSYAPTRPWRRPGLALTMYLGPEEVLLNLEVAFEPGLTASEIRAAVDRIEGRLRARYPEITRVFIEVGSLRVVGAGSVVNAASAGPGNDPAIAGPGAPDGGAGGEETGAPLDG